MLSGHPMQQAATTDQIRGKLTCTARPPLQALRGTHAHSLALSHTHTRVFSTSATQTQSHAAPSSPGRRSFLRTGDTPIMKARCNSHQQTVQVGNGVRGERLDPEHREHDAEPHCGREAEVRSGSRRAPAVPPGQHRALPGRAVCSFPRHERSSGPQAATEKQRNARVPGPQLYLNPGQTTTPFPHSKCPAGNQTDRSLGKGSRAAVLPRLLSEEWQSSTLPVFPGRTVAPGMQRFHRCSQGKVLPGDEMP